MSEDFKVRFWGVRGSHPTPGAGTVKYGGNTSSVEVRAGGRTIILDAGTGIIALGRELARRHDLNLLLLLSHLHHDHIQGFPFFVPAYLPSARLHIYGPGPTRESLARVLEQNQSSDTFPVGLGDMPACKDIRSIRETEILIWDREGLRVSGTTGQTAEDGVVIRLHRSHAHPGGVFVYRITWRGRSLVYATDTEGYIGTDRRLVAFARDTDLLIHDAQYSEAHYRGQIPGLPAVQGYGHSTARMAAEVAAAAGAGRLVLFHHEPSYTDEMVAAQEASARSVFTESQAAYEGLELMLEPRRTMTGGLQLPAHRSRDVKYGSNE